MRLSVRFSVLRIAAFALLSILHTGCTGSHSPSPGTPLEDIGRSVITNASFEKHDRESLAGWASGCRASTERSRTGLKSLVLVSGDVCRSSRFTVKGGAHYGGTLWLEGEGLAPRENLGNQFEIRLHLFDASGKEVAFMAPFLDRQKEDGVLSRRLQGLQGASLEGIGRFTEVTLIAGDYPLDAGWLPTEAISAELEFRFEGIGKIFIDDVHYSLSKWNRTLRQRVMDSGLTPYRIFPPPKRIGGDIPVSPEFPNCFRVSYAGIPSRALSKLGGIPVVEGKPCAEVTLELGVRCAARAQEEAVLCNAAAKSNEGYTIDGSQGRVEIRVSSKDAVPFALDTFEQILRDPPESGPWVVPAVIDYPSVSIRGNTGNNAVKKGPGGTSALVGWLAESRINTVFVNVEPASPRWWNPSTETRQAAQFLSAAHTSGSPVQLGILLNPYTGAQDPEFPFPFVISDDKAIERVVSTVSLFRRIGATRFVLRADDLVPTKPNTRFGYYLATDEDRAKYRSLAAAHLRLVGQVHACLKGLGLDALSFVPPWYNWWFISNSPTDAFAYGDEISNGLDANIPLVWTGPSVRSLFMDEVDIERYRNHVRAENLILWDNSTFARWHKDFWRGRPREYLSSLFEPYDVRIPLDSAGNPSHQSGVLLFFTFTERNRPALATAGAYWWNPEAYHPERALWTYLSRKFGKEGAGILLEFDELYFSVRSKWNNIEVNEREESKSRLLDAILRLEGVSGPNGADLGAELRTLVSRLHELEASRAIPQF